LAQIARHLFLACGNGQGSDVPMRAIPLCMAVVALIGLAVTSGVARADPGLPVANTCPEALDARYFPVGSPRGQPTHFANGTVLDHDLFVRQWFSKPLAAMKEPSLSCGVLEETEAYRFLWLRSFHKPVAVRVFRRGEEYRLEAVILDRAGGYEPGKVSRRVTKELSRDQWGAVVARLDEIQLWQMPTRENRLPGTDGARWIIEARRDGRYHVVDRWSGTDGLQSVGRLFLDLAGLSDVSPVY
jgi:hypothetical protein